MPHLPEDKITERNEGKVKDSNYKKEKNANQKLLSSTASF